MGLFTQKIKGKGTFPRGVHPPERKELSGDSPIEILPTPQTIVMPLLQNIGAPCKPVVKKKQEVAWGDVIAESDAYISAKIHAPISGVVQSEIRTTLPNGRHVPALPIRADGSQTEGKTLWDGLFAGMGPQDINGSFAPEDISNRIHAAGLVGLGGAAFPTHVKIISNEKKPVDTLLINGCECEPYLTTDYRLMVEAPAAIAAGALLGGLATGAREIFICIEDNKPEAIETMRQAVQGTRIKIAVLRTKYPQGSERHLIKAVLDRIMPLGCLPADVGVTVSNVGTIAGVAAAILKGRPLTHRVVTVTGGGIRTPKNILVPIGTLYRDLIDFCGGLTDDAAILLSGGPMMGFAFTDLDMPVTKGTSGLTILTREDTQKTKETACIRCGLCVDVCPMHLVPTRLALAAKHRNVEMAEKYNIMACMESGCCAYICPAHIPLVQLIRVGKAMTLDHRKKTGS